jgi:polysaccharide chain length determinant protein (PEP-CTERM system associated)
MYESSATILLEPSSIPPELVKTTVVSYADQQIELVQRTVMTPERLEKVVKEIDVYPGEDMDPRKKAQQIISDTYVQKVDPITYQPLPESSAFSVYYANPDPNLAAQVTERIANLFLEYNRETRTAAARDAYGFLLEKSKQLGKHIQDVEQQLSVFKTKFGDALPEARNRNEASLDRTQRDVDAMDAQIRVVEQQEQLLTLQLAQVSPMLVGVGTDTYTQLGQLRAELAAAQQKYTPDHPDVKRLTRAIQALAAQANVTADANIRPDNPEYLRISSELASVRRNLGALRAQAGRARTQIAAYEQRLSVSSTVERDYVQLEREREIAQQQFTEIKNRLSEAEIAQTLESEARGERFTLIRAPFVPRSPSSPNRLGIILMGLVLGGGLAVGWIALRESADPTVRGAVDIAALGNLAVIGAIPRLLNSGDRRRQRLIWGSVAGAYLVATVVVAATIFLPGL